MTSAELIEKSLTQARERAHAELNPDLLEALEWPRDLADYYDYLERSSAGCRSRRMRRRGRPRLPRSATPRRSATGSRTSSGSSTRRSATSGTAIAEGSTEFRDWLTEFARQWGSFLDTPESFGQELLDSFLDDAPEYTVEESLVDGRPNAPSGWLTFNQFFARELNAGLRPIASPGTTRSSPRRRTACSGTPSTSTDDSNIPATTVKDTHRYGNIEQLIEGSRYADAFAGGTFVHYMLPPSSYHRYHVPVAGRVEESFVLSGRVYMEVDLEDDEFQSKDNTADRLRVLPGARAC